MTLFQCLLLGFLVVCAISVTFSKNLLNSILIYMSYSLVMSIIWICLESPDLAITEAAVGAGVTSVLFFVTLKKIHAIRQEDFPEACEETSGQPTPRDETVHTQKSDAQRPGVHGAETAKANAQKSDAQKPDTQGAEAEQHE